MIDLLSGKGWFNAVGKIFFYRQERCLSCQSLGKNTCRSSCFCHGPGKMDIFGLLDPDDDRLIAFSLRGDRLNRPRIGEINPKNE